MGANKSHSIEGIRIPAFSRLLAGVGIFAIMGFLVFRELSAWHRFDWAVFYANLRYVSTGHALCAVAATYAGFFFRALRWGVFLRPVKRVPIARLFCATIVGFTGLALLGRPGELVRPYLIARREDLSISSQIAVLTLERIFDTAAVGILIASAVFGSSELQSLPYLGQFRRGSLIMTGFIAAVAILALLLAKNGQQLGSVLQRTLSPLSSEFARAVGELTSVFGTDLNRIKDMRSLASISLLSVLIWLLIALAHLESFHAFSSLRHLSLADALLLLGFSLLGSLAQLPGGGTQQVIVIVALMNVFAVPAELAVSCTILGWLTIFMIPVPLGLILLPQTRSSIRSLLQASRRAQPA